MVSILADIFNRILEHSKESYPHECCGALIGSFDKDGSKTIKGAVPLENINKERANDRYEMDPAELLKAEKEARAASLDVVGIYHSHPDHPSAPSEFDRDRGWPDYSYIIVAVENGEKTEARSWSFSEQDEPFKEEALKIIDVK